MSSIRSLANIDASFIQFGCSIIGVFFYLLEFVFIFNIVVNLNVSGALDISSMWILEIVDFFPLLFIDNCRLETQLLFLSILLKSKLAHHFILKWVLIECERNSFFKTVEFFSICFDIKKYHLDELVIVSETIG